MALKDWKKSGVNKWLKDGTETQVFYNNNSGKWSVLIGRRMSSYYFSSSELDKFKTKSQALKYAKAYMRRN